MYLSLSLYIYIYICTKPEAWAALCNGVRMCLPTHSRTVLLNEYVFISALWNELRRGDVSAVFRDLLTVFCSLCLEQLIGAFSLANCLRALERAQRLDLACKHTNMKGSYQYLNTKRHENATGPFTETHDPGTARRDTDNSLQKYVYTFSKNNTKHQEFHILCDVCFFCSTSSPDMFHKRPLTY